MSVRELTSDDRPAYRRLTAQAFGGGAVEEVPGPFPEGEIPLGVDSTARPCGQEGVLAAGARIRRDVIALGGGTTACGGIGGLAVHPAHRGGGLFGELLTGVLARCGAEGMAFSMLYPSNPAIYRRHGYQVVARTERIVVPLGELQRLRSVPGRRLVPVTEATIPRLRRLYTELTAEDNAMLRREPPLFPAGLPSPPWGAVLLEDEAGADRGYLSFSRIAPGSDGAGLEVHEILGRDRNDLLALLQHLGSWSTVTTAARVRLRAEDPILDVLPGGGLRTTGDIVPLVMMRLVDTARALADRPAPAGLTGSVRLEVRDRTPSATACRADGCWDVRAEGGVVHVEQISRDEPMPPADAHETPQAWARLDVHAAALFLTGGRSLVDARRAGLEAEADAAGEAFLDTLLRGPRPSVLDAF
ncbi:GNAT family N-acetyltransferase [Brachybacterium halotolerans subsp. kimchii]|uniref:GNAT family N-acetyltransferase n=1 Tax=Brachybacterium halotolerans TaxID=2795215 RepID=UPI001E608537|nr:GNAT family N-acetyltransferase [Brachybacterium halotolerans]UEJ83061.1 GNAT family N-acetyltransferase [Brachybacterium halotolerans subsp. kimchii]